GLPRPTGAVLAVGAGGRVPAHDGGALRHGHDTGEPVPALRPRGVAHGERDAGAGLLPVRALFSRAHAGRAPRGRGGPAAAHARHRRAAPGAARDRGPRAAAAVARMCRARRLRRVVPVARGPRDGPPGKALQAGGEAHTAMAMTFAAVRGSLA